MWKYFVAVIAILLAGCGGQSFTGSKAAVSVSSGTDIRDALGRAGLRCTGYKPVAKDDRQWGTESAADVGECELENEDIQLIVWKDNGQSRNWSGMVKAVGCTAGKVIGKSSFDYVDGGLWTVFNTSQTLAKKVSDAIGGKPEHIDCGG